MVLLTPTKTLLVGLIMVTTALPASASVWEEDPDGELPASPIPESCDSGNAYMIGDAIEDGTGNAYAFYQNPITDETFFSYALRGHTLTNGADEYAAGLQIWRDRGGSPNEYDHEDDVYPTTYDWKSRSRQCEPIGEWHDFSFWVTGGAVGWDSSYSLSFSIWVEVEVGVEFSLLKPDGEVEVSGRVGASVESTKETSVDTELLFDDRGNKHCGPTNTITDCFIDT